MSTAQTHYKVLRVLRGATGEEIKKAYRALALVHHPDRGGDEKNFKELNEANETLSDPETRAAYDATLPREQRAATYTSASGGGGGGQAKKAFPVVDLEQLFQDYGHNFSFTINYSGDGPPIVSSMRSGGGSTRDAKRPLETVTRQDLLVCAFGAKTQLKGSQIGASALSRHFTWEKGNRSLTSILLRLELIRLVGSSEECDKLYELVPEPGTQTKQTLDNATWNDVARAFGTQQQLLGTTIAINLLPHFRWKKGQLANILVSKGFIKVVFGTSGEAGDSTYELVTLP
jgi:hypothetical protein